MKYEDLICLDVESLTPMRAEMANRQIREEMHNTFNPACDKPKLQELLLATQQIITGPDPDPRKETMDRIADAILAGDKRLANQLETALADSDKKEYLDEQRQQQAQAENAKYWKDQEAKEAAEQKQQTEELINSRTQELFYAHGWTKTEAECRKIATDEVHSQLPWMKEQ